VASGKVEMELMPVMRTIYKEYVERNSIAHGLRDRSEKPGDAL
jgi:hypothetical protein